MLYFCSDLGAGFGLIWKVIRHKIANFFCALLDAYCFAYVATTSHNDTEPENSLLKYIVENSDPKIDLRDQNLDFL